MPPILRPLEKLGILREGSDMRGTPTTSPPPPPPIPSPTNCDWDPLCIELATQPQMSH